MSAGFRQQRIHLQCRRTGSDLWVGKIPWRRAWQPTPVFLPGGSMDRGAWRATDHRVAKSRTRLKRLSTQAHSSTLNSPQHGYWCCRHSPGCFLATRGVGAPSWWDIHMFSLGIHVCSGLSLGWPLGRKEGTGLCGSVTTLPEKRKGLFTYRLSWNSPLEL